ncbi:MAG: ribosome biogenesis GTPase Der [Saprospiraceae bacterium]|nr:ribosome biogenesis GTPase Der [Saprospiraceae bacterium]MCF8249711.1 ribosome biogenesis GTPase Der [Saprospiraceae bacterium]MCF8282497.1 ribosome biogenesis GTPase Der [Bacteroidales bacterium]MCF8314082.1 ribosome biogenesis GTPase Der [Saprospiraceae bacterium]MCF8442827.1 ribosome biogenesis GTPase Der [Saprospiraceae bacterium]
MGNIVAIVGRPNVGKSTIFNRLIGGRQAIVDDTSGVTRDRQYGTCEWNGKIFNVVDTGGFVEHSDDIFEMEVRSQVKIAIEEASIIIFMVDVTTGITDLDEDVTKLLRRSKIPVLLCVNKVDNHERYLLANEFYSLGFEQLFFVSSLTGSGTGELLDAVTEHISEDAVIETDLPKFAIVGQPNVGKSSLVNALLGEDRNIVTDIAGTTRDTIHSKYSKFGKEFILLDTAGIRKKAKVHENLEFYSVMRAIQAIEESDVCILMIDAQTGIEAQDMSIFRLAQKRNKGMVLLVNKWDLVENKETNSVRDYEAEMKRKIAPFSDVPIIFISVHEKQRIFKAVEEALQVYENRSRKLKTSFLNDQMQPEIERYSPPMHRGRTVSIKFMNQLPTPYPAFVFYCSNPKHVKDSYKQFLENRMREKFQFTGVPITIFFREK